MASREKLSAAKGKFMDTELFGTLVGAITFLIMFVGIYFITR